MTSLGRRSLGTLLGAALLACGPAPTTHPPSSPGCLPTARAVIGTWSHQTSAMELRPDGYLLRNSLEGTYRWTDPGRVQLDVGGMHLAYTLGLSNVVTLLLVDPDGHGEIWTRLSPAPSIPPDCYDVRGSLVGDWTDGLSPEHFGAAGEYERSPTSGSWAMVEAGAIEITALGVARREQVALATPSMLVIVPQPLDPSSAGGVLEVIPGAPRIVRRLASAAQP